MSEVQAVGMDRVRWDVAESISSARWLLDGWFWCCGATWTWEVQLERALLMTANRCLGDANWLAWVVKGG